MEECPVKAPIEEACVPSCSSIWAQYEACKQRISSFDTLDIHKLQHIAEHHGVPTIDTSKVFNQKKGDINTLESLR